MVLLYTICKPVLDLHNRSGPIPKMAAKYPEDMTQISMDIIAATPHDRQSDVKVPRLVPAVRAVQAATVENPYDDVLGQIIAESSCPGLSSTLVVAEGLSLSPSLWLTAMELAGSSTWTQVKR